MGEPIEPNVATSTSDPKSLGWWLLVANACCALCIYSISAGQTVGHRGDLGRMWIAGRFVAEGRGASLYDPVQQEAALRPYLDDDNIAGLHMKGIGWLTYPPVQGVLYAPLGATSPAAAQWWMVQISLCAVVVAAFGLSRIHSHGVSASVAILTLLLQPAFFSNVASGQNATVTLAIIVVGWGLLLRDRAILAGAVWGLLAYMAYQYVTFGDALAFAKTQAHWSSRPDLPWAERLLAIVTFQPIWSLYVPGSSANWIAHERTRNPLFSLVFWNGVYFMASCGIVAYGARRKLITTHEWLLAVGLLAIPYALQGYRMMMMGQGRFTCVVFPVFIVLGKLMAKWPAPATNVVFSLMGVQLLYWSALFAAWYYVF